MTANISLWNRKHLLGTTSSGAPFHSQPSLKGFVTHPTSRSPTASPSHAQRVPPCPVWSCLLEPNRSVNFCLQAGWPGIQGSGSCSRSTPNCLCTQERVTYYLWTFVYSTVGWADGNLECYVNKDSEAISRPQERTLNRQRLPVTQERMVTINPLSLKCMILNGSSVRHFALIISTIASDLL